MKALYWSFFSALGWAALATTLTATKSLAANPQHVSQLESTGQCESCDLSGASFVGIDFSEVQVNLQNANLNGANFTGATMPKVNLNGASAIGATFFGTDLQGATLKNTNLPYSNLVKVKLNNAILEKTDFYSANLAEADLSGAKVTKTNFVGASIYKMQYSPSIKDANLGNSFKSDRPGTQRGLENGTTIIEKITGDRTLESGRNKKRRYRVPGWIGKPPTSTTEGSRQFNSDGTPLN
jgi:Pentapeptide repeats (8 copies)